MQTATLETEHPRISEKNEERDLERPGSEERSRSLCEAAEPGLPKADCLPLENKEHIPKPHIEPSIVHASNAHAIMSQTNTVNHIYCDSLVTVRLSDAQLSNNGSFHTNSALASPLPSLDGSEEVMVAKSISIHNVHASAPSRPRVRFSDPDYRRPSLPSIRTSESCLDSGRSNWLRREVGRRLSTDFAVEDFSEPTVEIDDLRSMQKRRDSSRSISSTESTPVDWEALEKNEQDEPQGEQTDEATAFLLARLEQENNTIAADPKSGASRSRSRSRPPSLQFLKKLVNEPQLSSLRYSQLPPPPAMTELEFWSALVKDYKTAAHRLPTLTTTKIRAGIPPPLRGVVWMSIVGAREADISEEYERLCSETSPYEKLIGKDIGRSFPGVDMFRDPDGDGQKMLGKVLNAFSLYDKDIGYCQGLGFVVGPLIMHMPDVDAFSILIRLMEHYDLRSCFLPDLSGLHLRIYQFQHLLGQHLPRLTTHLEELKIEPLYCSQWFLSFFGVTCPLPMLIRIYDILLTEGASETLMRVALSLMRRNEEKLLAATEFEDIMQLLLSRSLWDTYNCNADDLVNDFCSWTGLVTRENLAALETSFKSQADNPQKSGIHSAASRFLGRLWSGSNPSQKAGHLATPSLSTPARPTILKRTPSKQSMASTLNSIESNESNPTHSTDATDMSRQPSADWVPLKPAHAVTATTNKKGVSDKDKDLHNQIEDLLTALSEAQRESSLFVSELQREREERDEDRALVQKYLLEAKSRDSVALFPDERKSGDETGENFGDNTHEYSASLLELESHFATKDGKRSSLLRLTKQQLRDEALRWKQQYQQELSKTQQLSQQIEDNEAAAARARDDLREARSRIQLAHQDKQRLEKTILDLKKRKSLVASDTASCDSDGTLSSPTPPSSGLRSFKLGRTPSTASTKTTFSLAQQQSPMCIQSPPDSIPASATSSALPTPTSTIPPQAFSKRSSSLAAQTILATDNHEPVPDDTLLLELVNAKTAEAVARQELEEVKAKLEGLKRLMGGGLSPGIGTISSGENGSKCNGNIGRAEDTKVHASTPSSASLGGGFFSGWGKRAVSATAATGSGGQRRLD